MHSHWHSHSHSLTHTRNRSLEDQISLTHSLTPTQNSMRAVVENNPEDMHDELPPIDVVLVKGDEDLTIKV